MPCYLVLNENDNVAVATEIIAKGTIAELPQGSTVEIKSEIPLAHKFAIKSILKGERIFKYGEVIGMATKGIEIGEHVHVHNVRGFYVSEIEEQADQ